MTDGMLLALICSIALIVLFPFFIIVAMLSRMLYRLKRIEAALVQKVLVKDDGSDQ